MQTLREQARAVAAREVSPLELVEDALEALEAVQDRTNAFTEILAEQARERARTLEARDPAGELHGVPLVVKDLFDVAGIPTTGCCEAYNCTPTQDAVAVQALLRAGAIVLAKTNQDELAAGATNRFSSAGPARNPWSPEHIPGGSSGGSAAAVAANVVAGALGTDAGGSVRIPSSFCGTTGLKPTLGAVSTRGAMPTAPSLDVVGPITRNADDCMLLYRLVVGFDPEDPVSVVAPSPAATTPVGELRMGIPVRYYELLHPETRAAVSAAADVFASLGARVTEVETRPPDDGVQALLAIATAEIAHNYRALWDDPRLGPVVPLIFEGARQLPAADLAGAYDLARDLRRDFERVFADVDVLLWPTTPYPAPGLEQMEVEVEGGTLDTGNAPARLTQPVNVAGLPAMSFPVGFTPDGLPLGAQLVGPPWSEEQLGAAVSAYQQATDWHQAEPAQ